MSVTASTTPSAAVEAAIAAVTAPLAGVAKTSIPCTPENPRGVDPNVPFTLDLNIVTFLTNNHQAGSFPREIAALIVAYMTQHFDNVIFGPGHWQQCWNAAPITLPDAETLRAWVVSKGLKVEEKVRAMSAEACATLLLQHGETVGTVDNPVPPAELIAFLSAPVERGKEPNLLRYVVTYIPSYVRVGDKVLAVTARMLALELAPNPSKGCYAACLKFPDSLLDKQLTANGAGATQEACYFVMEHDVAPGTKGEKPSVLLDRVKQRGAAWSAPGARNFIATVFSIRALTGVFLFGEEHPSTYTYSEERTRKGSFLYLGEFDNNGLYGYGIGDLYITNYGIGHSRKFWPLAPKP